MVVLNSFDTSVKKALDEITPDWPKYNGLIICGTHAPDDPNRDYRALKKARTTDTPTLGICWGMQAMAIEWMRNKAGIFDATSEEVGDGTPIVYKLPKLRVGLLDTKGGKESHWHQYAVDTEVIEQTPFHISVIEGIVEDMTLPNHPFYRGVQYHPEYQSSKRKPHPLLVEFLDAARGTTK